VAKWTATIQRAKIICTIGPASREVAVLRQLVEAGMDVARLNFSHGSHAEHAENISRIRSVALETGVPVAILADLQGPKLRVGEMIEGGVRLEAGREVVLTTESTIGRDVTALPVQYAGLPRLVGPDDRILLDDGLLELYVLATSERTVRCRVLVGGVLRSNKGINLPGASPDIPSLTAKDRSDLAFALAQGVDWVALSFVRTADEVRDLRRAIEASSPSGQCVPVMSKIEKPTALDNIQQIMDASDAIMVARGDLGIELSAEQVPLAQKRIIQMCNQAGVPVVTATQMLDSMIRNPRPTRAEASDVANAILDGTDAIMLSGETSIGAYPVEAVRTMDTIAAEVEAHRGEAWCCPAVPAARGTGLSAADAVSLAAGETAHALDAAAIIAPTVSGYTARLMSHHRPRSRIVAVTPDPTVQRQLMLYWGVIPLLAPRTESTDEIVDHAVQTAAQCGIVHSGDTLVVTAGAAGSAPGTTNLMRVYTVE
jgi:pyruvate kinase